MFLANLHEYQPQDFYIPYRIGSSNPAPPMLNFLSMAPYRQEQHIMPAQNPASNSEVIQALEIARESPDGAKDPIVSSILEKALSQIWERVQAHPDSYVMSRDEFAVFNFFQHRFQGNKMATAARSRYWDNTTGSS
ncbi:Uu.00g105930.m01.CDS01 [Anthostomella pinea]|uniref:Uu.00g105930.m01.CDS01 n=1 Tax=Anthostomella pinea TaxID=933095 RepID=A0AAI8VEJ4_9PEZI|nr:Uu.00g105930.m01.CDS01 [Anthostomella pinea]